MSRAMAKRAVNAVWLLITAASLYYVLRFGEAKSTRSDLGPQSAQPVPLASSAPAASEPHDAERDTIRIGWTAWADAEFISLLAKRIIETHMPLDVDLVMSDIGIQYQGLASGDLDLMLMAWLPVTHADYWHKVSDEVVNLGPLYTRARLGWAVPSYVPKARLSSIEDLRKRTVKRRLAGKIQGIDPGSGLMQASERVLTSYDLDFELVSSSGAAMTAALDRAIRRQEWIVVTAWSPHWMFAKWDLRYLEDPKSVMGRHERVHALARKGLYQEEYGPRLTELVSRMYLPLRELEAALLYATEHSVQEAVGHYLEQHDKRVRYWVTGEPG